MTRVNYDNSADSYIHNGTSKHTLIYTLFSTSAFHSVYTAVTGTYRTLANPVCICGIDFLWCLYLYDVTVNLCLIYNASCDDGLPCLSLHVASPNICLICHSLSVPPALLPASQFPRTHLLLLTPICIVNILFLSSLFPPCFFLLDSQSRSKE